ncbi:MAG: NAD(P)-dependent oxidoreductase [Chloroflexi bacterium]|nr:NAD(P)-dependent oxidoreductase [Chloroflexota bacterium]
MNIAVTGGAGRVGEVVCAHAAARGHTPIAVDSDLQRLLRVGSGAELRRADVCDLGQVTAALDGAEAVIHLAAITHPRWDSAPEVYGRNTRMTMNVFEAARLLGIGRVAQASSESTLGFSFAYRHHGPDWYPITEEHPLRPQDGYGLSKLAAEQIAQAYQRRCGIDSVSFRFCRIIYADAWEKVVAPLRPATGSGAHQLWSYVAVEDAADALLAAIEAPLRGTHAVYATAPDTYMDEPTAELMAAHYPEATLRGGPHPANVAVISSQRAMDLLGWQAAVNWRSRLK